MDIESIASNCNSNFKFFRISVEPMCKYVGIYIVCKFCFISHTYISKMRLGKLSWVVSILRRFIPRTQLLDFYRSDIALILQHGILIYRCCRFNILSPNFIMQKKIFFFSKRTKSLWWYIRTKQQAVYKFRKFAPLEKFLNHHLMLLTLKRRLNPS